MDEKRLLDVLREEMVLLEAKSRGAAKAYKEEAVCQFANECKGIGTGSLVTIHYSDGDAKAEISGRPEYSDWAFKDYKGPIFNGYLILKSGKKAKHKTPLFNVDMWRAKQVALAT